MLQAVFSMLTIVYVASTSHLAFWKLSRLPRRMHMWQQVLVQVMGTRMTIEHVTTNFTL
jgi:2-methylaconitate cis-trans-isomerase PrpF